ncbi:hypothetical protein EBS40_09770, partial [bacterium]|nr:hypothetical protein [bacterium]
MPHHKQCWARLDDEWLAANPGKTAADLPNRALAKASSKKPHASITEPMTVPAPVESNGVDVGNSVYNGLFLNYPCAESNALPHSDAEPMNPPTTTAAEVTIVLDSGASTSCFKQGLDFEPLPQPVPVKGAVAGSSSVARGTTAL